MTGPQLRAALADLGISRYQFAIVSRVDPSTVYKWTNPGGEVPGYAVAIFELLQEIKGLRRLRPETLPRKSRPVVAE